MGLVRGQDRIRDEFMDICRLGALRLEDLQDFYCDRKMAGYDSILSDNALSDSALSDAALPTEE